MGRFLLVMAALTAGLGAMFGPIERAIVYPFGSARIAPADAGEARLQEITFKADDETLILWVAPPEGNKPVILYFHGNAGNLANRAGRFKHFLDRGYGVIAPAYRGSSGSTGTASEIALSNDANLVYYAISKLVRGLTHDRVVLYGESLGTGVVVALLASVVTDTTKGGGPPAAVILEAPYTSIEAVAVHTYPALSPLIKLMQNKWNSLVLAPNISAPLLVLHGDKDSLIPISQGRQIYAAAGSDSKKFVPVKGASHTTIWRSDTLPEMWKFIDTYADK